MDIKRHKMKINRQRRHDDRIRRMLRFLESDALLYAVIGIGICAAAWAVYVKLY